MTVFSVFPLMAAFPGMTVFAVMAVFPVITASVSCNTGNTILYHHYNNNIIIVELSLPPTECTIHFGIPVVPMNTLNVT